MSDPVVPKLFGDEAPWGEVFNKLYKDNPSWFDDLDDREDLTDDDTDVSSSSDGTGKDVDEAAEAQYAEFIPDDRWRTRDHKEDFQAGEDYGGRPIAFLAESDDEYSSDEDYVWDNYEDMEYLVSGRGRARLGELKRLEELEGHTRQLWKVELSKKMAACTLTADGSQSAGGGSDKNDLLAHKRRRGADEESDERANKRCRDDNEMRIKISEEDRATFIDKHPSEDDGNSPCESDEDRSMDDGEGLSASDEDRYEDDSDRSCASVDYPSMDSKRWVHVGDCARLLPQSIQRIWEFFEGRHGVVTRAQCHEHARQLAGRDDATVAPAEAQFAGAYTVEVTTPDQDQHSMMTMLQFRASDAGATDQASGPSLALFGRFVPERCDMGEWVPAGAADAGHALRVWRLRCPRGRPLASVADKLARQRSKKNPGRFAGIMEHLAE
ncbi:hypothetical protein F5X97DRAFT_290662 [Nemania serpens]|nr:hypothetical protein F5X97DRAFT_290662 [Nemania serpens]